ncbi:hypothetical protein [Lacisediminihabitans changchengi]|nr:hypothetical protein [Lacisediminihabitans changchengi]
MVAVLIGACAVLAGSLLAVSWMSVVVLAEYSDETDEFSDD